jgi:hypothetical protein
MKVLKILEMGFWRLWSVEMKRLAKGAISGGA